MFGFIKAAFLGLLTSIVQSSNHTKCIFLSNQQCKTRRTLINLNPNEDSEGLHFCPFVATSDKRVGSCNTLNELSNKVYVPNKT